MAEFTLVAKSFLEMNSPIETNTEKKKYVCYVQARSIPSEFNEWMLTNPREQKMTTNVAATIVNSLTTNEDFHELNRGILMSVNTVSFDEETNTLTITMKNPEIHGNIDGGHTLRAILNAQVENNLPDDRYVFFEIFTGVDSPVELAAARNTSVQVDLKSIAELKNSFDVIKKVFDPLPFSDRIAYKMNEHHGVEGVTPIDVREVIAITIMFSQSIYPYKTSQGHIAETQPIQCYTGKEVSLKKFLGMGKERREAMILEMAPIIPDIFELWDKVECTFPEVSSKAGKRYGTRKYSKYNNGKNVASALFSPKPLQYVVPKGLMYPLVGSFRALVKVDPEINQYGWIKQPIKVWDELGGKLTTIILDEQSDNPDSLAKNGNLWSNLFKEVFIHAHL